MALDEICYQIRFAIPLIVNMSLPVPIQNDGREAIDGLLLAKVLLIIAVDDCGRDVTDQARRLLENGAELGAWWAPRPCRVADEDGSAVLNRLEKCLGVHLDDSAIDHLGRPLRNRFRVTVSAKLLAGPALSEENDGWIAFDVQLVAQRFVFIAFDQANVDLLGMG